MTTSGRTVVEGCKVFSSRIAADVRELMRHSTDGHEAVLTETHREARRLSA